MSNDNLLKVDNKALQGLETMSYSPDSELIMNLVIKQLEYEDELLELRAEAPNGKRYVEVAYLLQECTDDIAFLMTKYEYPEAYLIMKRMNLGFKDVVNYLVLTDQIGEDEGMDRTQVAEFIVRAKDSICEILDEMDKRNISMKQATLLTSDRFKDEVVTPLDALAYMRLYFDQTEDKEEV